MRNLEPHAYQIPPILASECTQTLSAYYGSRAKAGFALLKDATFWYFFDKYWGVVWWCSDRIGWTYLKPIPGTSWLVRHGKDCDCDCHDEMGKECIYESIPRWFKWLTRIDR